MAKIFRTLIKTSPRALVILFLMLVFAMTGVLTIRELTDNVEKTVSAEARPYLGGDIALSANSTFTGSLRASAEALLSKENGLKFSEKIDFYTTLFDAEGKSQLVRIVAVDEGYPMYSKYSISPINSGSGLVSATPNVISRFGQTITLDSTKIQITRKIDETSEIGVSFGDEGYLIILPREVLKNTQLLSTGARLQKKFLIQTTSDVQTTRLYTLLKTELSKTFGPRTIDVDSYITNAKKTNEVVAELSRYTLMIIVICMLLGAVTLYSAIDGYSSAIRASL